MGSGCRWAAQLKRKRRGRTKGIASRGNAINFGDYGLKAMEPGWVTNRQIEAGRIAITRHVKRGGKVWIRVFPDKPVTHKPAETRMGKGKGAPDGGVAVVRPGLVLYEIEGVDEGVAKEALRLASHKFGIATKFISRR